MSDKIKAAYDNDPTAGNDPSAAGYIAVGVGGSTARGDSFDQLANAVSHILGLAGNLPDQDTFSAVMQTNSTVATIDAIVTSYTHYNITEDTETVPTSGTNGTIVTNYDLVTWTPKKLRLYISSDGSSFSEVLNSGGLSGITLTPTYTIPPTLGTFSLAAGTDATSEIDYTLASASSVVGIDRYEVWDWDTQTPIQTGAALTGTLSNLISGKTYNLFMRVYDSAVPENTADSNRATLITDTTAVSVIQFSSISYEIDEDDAASDITITLDRTGDTSVASEVRITAVDVTADSSRYLAPVKDGSDIRDSGTPSNTGDKVTMGIGVSTITFEVDITDVSSTLNQQFELQIDRANLVNATRGDIPDCLVLLNGSGTSAGGYLEVWEAGDSRHQLVLSPDLDHSLTTGPLNGENYLNVTESSVVSSPGISADSYSNASTNVFHTDVNYVYGDLSEYEVNAPFVSFEVEFIATGQHYFWMRSQHFTSSGYTGYIGIDRNRSFPYSQYWNTLSLSNDVWGWKSVAETGINITTTGAHTVQMYPRHGAENIFHNKILITDDASFTPNDTTAEYSDSSKTSAVPATDDLGNISFPIGSQPAASVAPTTKFPLNGAVNVAISTQIIATFAGYTNISVSAFSLAITGGGSISGAYTTNNVDAVIFIPSTPLSNGDELTPSITGRVTASDGTEKAIDVGTWAFTTVELSGAIEFLQDHNSLTLGPMTDASLKAAYSAQYAIIASNASVEIVTDPLGDPSRGNVLKAKIAANTYGGGVKVLGPITARDEYYFAYDVYIPATQQIALEMKLAGLASHAVNNEANVSGGGTAEDGFSYRFMMEGEGIGGITEGIPGSNAIMAYIYYEAFSATRNAGKTIIGTDPERLTRSERMGNEGGLAVGIIPGKWNNVQQQIKVNTTGGDTTGSIMRMWVNGFKTIDLSAASGSTQLIAWRGTSKTHQIDHLWAINLFHGGNTSEWTVPDDNYYYYDNVTVSTDQIIDTVSTVTTS